MIKTNFTNEYLLNLLIELYNKINIPLNATILSKEREENKNFPENRAFTRRFNSIENACKLANVPYQRKNFTTSKNKKNERVGLHFKNSLNEEFKIVQYNGANDVLIEFVKNPNFLIHNSWSNIIKGIVKNPYAKNIFNVACVGNTKTKINGIKKESYKVWYSMLQRCYKECYINKPTYKDCTVCDEWLCFENFEKWYNENYYEVDDEIMNLDKDILVKGNKIYSPETCCFVPKRINILFVNTTNKETIKNITYLYYNKIPNFIYEKIYENYIKEK